VADRLHFLDPVAPREMERAASVYDLGLIAETGCMMNRRIALTNKQFTYLLAGIPLLMSDISAHRSFAGEAAGASYLFANESADDLARAADEILGNPQRLAAARDRAYGLGQERFNWEQEQHTLLRCVEGVVADTSIGSRQHGS
jgi:hypothetical protein